MNEFRGLIDPKKVIWEKTLPGKTSINNGRKGKFNLFILIKIYSAKL